MITILVVSTGLVLVGAWLGLGLFLARISPPLPQGILKEILYGIGLVAYVVVLVALSIVTLLATLSSLGKLPN